MAPIQHVSNAFDRISTYLKSDTLKRHGTIGARALNTVIRRSTYTPTGAGVTEPGSIPNTAIFVLFGIIGAGFVITGIWFFFWAKNGGIYFKQDDWEEYKSTVLRRKGPNGTTLSGATESTDLGGGSIYKDYDHEDSVYEKKPKKSKRKFKRSRKAKSEATADEESALGAGEPYEEGPDADVRAYRHEKPARVGGMNRAPDGSAFDGSTAHSGSTADGYSDLLSEKTPSHTPTRIRKHRKAGHEAPSTPNGIRKVAGSVSETTSTSSYWSGTNRDDEYIRSEARKLQEKGRAAQRRDFSFTAGTEDTVSVDEERRNRRREERRRKSKSPTKKSVAVPSTLSETDDGDLGTKSYYHTIPGLSSAPASDYAEEKRKNRRGGYRRARGDDSDMEEIDVD